MTKNKLKEYEEITKTVQITAEMIIKNPEIIKRVHPSVLYNINRQTVRLVNRLSGDNFNERLQHFSSGVDKPITKETFNFILRNEGQKVKLEEIDFLRDNTDLYRFYNEALEWLNSDRFHIPEELHDQVLTLVAMLIPWINVGLSNASEIRKARRRATAANGKHELKILNLLKQDPSLLSRYGLDDNSVEARIKAIENLLSAKPSFSEYQALNPNFYKLLRLLRTSSVKNRRVAILELFRRFEPNHPSSFSHTHKCRSDEDIKNSIKSHFRRATLKEPESSLDVLFKYPF